MKRCWFVLMALALVPGTRGELSVKWSGKDNEAFLVYSEDSEDTSQDPVTCNALRHALDKASNSNPELADSVESLPRSVWQTFYLAVHVGVTTV